MSAGRGCCPLSATRIGEWGSHRTRPTCRAGNPVFPSGKWPCLHPGLKFLGGWVRIVQVARGSPHTWQAWDGFVGRRWVVEVGTGSIWSWKALKSGRVTESHSLEGGETQERHLAPCPQGLRVKP